MIFFKSDYRTSESSGAESCCSACLNNTVTTIISNNNRNKTLNKCCSDSDDQNTEQNYKTSLIKNINEELSDSFSSSSDLSDYNRNDNRKFLIQNFDKFSL